MGMYTIKFQNTMMMLKGCWFRCLLIPLQAYGSLKRRRNSLLVLIGVSVLACGLYCATYFQAVAASWQWKSTQWFLITSSLPIKQPATTGSSGLSPRLLLLSPSFHTDVQRHMKKREEEEDDEVDNWEANLACHLPKLNPMDPSIVSFIKAPPSIDCQQSYPLLFRTDFHSTLIQLKDLEDISCSYRPFQRGNYSDVQIQFSEDSIPIVSEKQEIPEEHEFIDIRCKNVSSANEKEGNETEDGMLFHRDMFAFVPLKSKTEERVAMTLAEMRKGSKEKKESRDQGLNVVILGLDAQSHMNFLRQMPLTSAYLLKNLSAISLDGYTKVSDNTFPNIIPLLTGLNVTELKEHCWPTKETPFDYCPFIWKRFAEAGYRTSLAEDSVWMGAFNYDKYGFFWQPTDYYLHPLTGIMAKKIGHTTSGNSELCYGPRLGFEVLLDYIVKTAVAFGGSDKRHENNGSYFQFVWANSLFHDFLNNPGLGDELLYLTFRYLHHNGYLNRTAFLLISDHGIRWGAIRTTYQGKIEERMPLAYLIFPEWFHRMYPKAMTHLKLNSKILSTPFDLHRLLEDLLEQKYRGDLDGRNKAVRGMSLFHPVPPHRTCPDAEISEHWCVCNALQPLAVNLSIVEEAARFIVQRINGMLAHLQDNCAPLELATIYAAVKTIHSHFEHTFKPSNNNSSSNKTIESAQLASGGQAMDRTTLQVTIVTSPGQGVFEGTVSKMRKKDDKWQLDGEISRLSLYGSQANCISHFTLQKYCYCLNGSEKK